MKSFKRAMLWLAGILYVCLIYTTLYHMLVTIELMKYYSIVLEGYTI